MENYPQFNIGQGAPNLPFYVSEGFDIVRRDVGGSSIPFPAPCWNNLLSSGIGFSSSGITVSPLTALQSSAAHACVDRVASDIGKLPIKLLRKVGKSWVWVQEHSLLSLMRFPNVRNTYYELMYNTVFTYLATGNGYIAIIRDNKTGLVRALIPMSLNNKVSPLEGERGEITYACSNKLFRAYEKPNGSHDMRRRFSEDDMIHLRRMSLDGVTGTSVFSTSSEVLGLALAAQELAAKTFKNGATFGFAITTPIKMTPQTVEQTQNDFIRNQSGILNAGKPPIMHSGTELQKISMTPEETQLLAAREHTDAEICRLLGVPHALLGIGTNGTSNTYKNLEQDMRAYVDSTLMKIISPLEELFNQRLLYDPQRFDGNGHVIPAPPGGELRDEYRFEFDTSALLRADKQARYQTYKTGIESKFLLPNEARAEEGFAPVEGGDEFPDLKSSTTVNVGQQNSDRKDPSEPETSPDEVEP